jgi:hypothetical protein
MKKDVSTRLQLSNLHQRELKSLNKKTAEFEQIRIKFVYLNSSWIDSDYYPKNKMNIVDINEEVISIFESEYISPIVEIFKDMIMLYPRKEKIFLNDRICAYNEPTNYKSGIDNIDLVIIYTFESSQLKFRAKAQPCFLDNKFYNRPTTGIMFFNLNLFNITQNATYQEKKFRLITIKHELVHILGFSPFLYDKFIDFSGNEYNLLHTEKSNEKSFINTPLLTEFSREYFGCKKMPGMMLEMSSINGTSLSHWERSLIKNELMTGSSIYNFRIITNFTLKLLDDTGWYKINYKYSEETIWGKNKTCEFIKPECYRFSEFCLVKNELSCDYEYNYISTCVSEKLSDCSYMYGFQSCLLKEYFEKKLINNNNDFSLDNYNFFGSDSKCIIGSVDGGSFSPRCQRVYCDVDKKNIVIYINDKYVTCAKNETDIEKTLYIYETEFNFKCPNYSRVCYLYDSDVLYGNDILSSINIGSIHIFLSIIILLIS